MVLIDIAGGQDAKNRASKAQKLQGLINDWNGKPEFKGLTFEGVVLCPSFPGPSPRAAPGEVQQVSGRDARDLLGGLDQVFRWFDRVDPVSL